MLNWQALATCEAFIDPREAHLHEREALTTIDD
jgi:hypothetical protein